MKNVFQKPFFFFWMLIPIFILINVLDLKKSIDINIHDTYIIIEISQLSLYAVFLFLLIGVNYFIIHKLTKPLNTWITRVHIILQIVVLIPFIIFLISDEITPSLSSTILSMDANLFIVIQFLIFFISLIIHFINFVMSIFIYKKITLNK